MLWSPLPDARKSFSLAPCASHAGQSSLIKCEAGPGISTHGLYACAILGAVAMFVEFSHGGARPGAGRPRVARHSNTGLPVLDIMRWYCVRTDFNGQLRADIEVRLAGFEVFNPSVFRPAEPMRRDRNGMVRPAKPDRIVPMFPRYFLTRFNIANPSWGEIEHLDGVDRLMTAPGGRPGAIADDKVALLFGLVQPNHCAYPANHLHMNPIDPGTCLRLLSGGMEGREGICEWSDGRRVKLLLQILGRPVSVTVSQAAVASI
jgi:transcription antitermination factor NusG